MDKANNGHPNATASAKPKTTGMKHGGTGGGSTKGKNNGKSYK